MTYIVHEPEQALNRTQAQSYKLTYLKSNIQLWSLDMQA